MGVIETLAETVNELKGTVSEMSEKMTKIEAKLPEDTEEPDDQQTEDLLDQIALKKQQKTEKQEENEDEDGEDYLESVRAK